MSRELPEIMVSSALIGNVSVATIACTIPTTIGCWTEHKSNREIVHFSCSLDDWQELLDWLDDIYEKLKSCPIPDPGPPLASDLDG